MSQEHATSRTALRARLDAGEVLYGSMVYEFFTPGLPTVLHEAGLDFAIFDLEATPLGLEQLRILCHLSNAVGLAPMVRMPTGDDPMIGRCLNVGAVGVMAPHIESVAAAESFVAATRWPPRGTRGVGYSSYPDAYLKPVDATGSAAVLTIAQLESPAAIERAEPIAAVDGLDVLNVGAADLAASLGERPDRTEAVRDAIGHTHAVCLARGSAYGGRLGADGGPAGPAHRLVLLEHDTAALSARLHEGLAQARTGVDACRSAVPAPVHESVIGSG